MKCSKEPGTLTFSGNTYRSVVYDLAMSLILPWLQQDDFRHPPWK
ncbi:MAG: hypothetical protein ACOXZ4_07565 [Sphaerochaetaceae bacterium]